MFILILTVFTARRYASAVYAVVVHMSICPSVCPSDADIVSKRLKRKQSSSVIR